MLKPVLNKESTEQELASLCWLLNEIKSACIDVNLRWKVCQLAHTTDELCEKFFDEYNFLEQGLSIFQAEYFQKLPLPEKVTAMLSAAFNNASIINAARFDTFNPGYGFKESSRSITNQILSLLHESRGWLPEEDD